MPIKCTKNIEEMTIFMEACQLGHKRAYTVNSSGRKTKQYMAMTDAL